MRKLTPTGYLFIVLLGLASCKNDGIIYGCTAQYLPEPINFKVVDKVSGQDQFFSQTPPFSVNDLKIIYKGQNIPIEIMTSVTEKYFTLSTVSLKLGTDTLFLKIGSQPSEPIVYTLLNNDKICPQPTIKKIIYNGITEIEPHLKIITLKR